jgi:hypothetical protein
MPSAATADDRNNAHIDSRWPVAGGGKHGSGRIGKIDRIVEQRLDAAAVQHQEGEAADDALMPLESP